MVSFSLVHLERTSSHKFGMNTVFLLEIWKKLVLKSFNYHYSIKVPVWTRICKRSLSLTGNFFEQ